ncbi:hypothetical protein G6F31_019629 [Rhizopus arrhizus]|nr:hypothetical protein G6F31_019629 [Rhizopus arrhizus]
MAGSLRAAQHQDPFGAGRHQGVHGRRCVPDIDVAVGVPLRQAQGFDDQQVGLRQHQFQRGGQQVVGIVLGGGVRGQGGALAQVQHQRHLAVVRGDLGGNACRFSGV